MTSWVAGTQNHLQSYQNDLKAVAAILEALAGELRTVDRPPQGLLGTLGINEHVDEASNYRSAASTLIGRYAPEPPNPLMTFFGDVGTFLKQDFVDPVVDLGKWAWGVTGEAFVDEKQWEKNLHDTGQGFVNVYDAFANHPGETFAAIGESIIQKDQLDKDPAAWGVSMVATIASFFIGAGEVKAALAGVKGAEAAADTSRAVKLLSDVRDASKLSETASVLSKYPELAKRTHLLDKNAMTKWSETKDQFQRGNFFENDYSAIKINEDKLWVQTRNSEKTIDTFLIDTSHDRLQVQSVKTIDPAAKTYANSPNVFYSTLDKYAETAKMYEHPNRISGIDIPRGLSQSQDIVIGLPETGLTDAQAAKLNDLVTKYTRPDANGRSLDIMFVEAPR